MRRDGSIGWRCAAAAAMALLWGGAMAAEERGPEMDAAILVRAGKRDIGVHDPSTLVKEGDTWWLFGTGRGVNSFHSTDLVHWRRGPSLFPDPPSWITDVAATQKGHFWAPDVIRHDGRYLVYYSVSAFGKNTSAIALAASPTLDPSSPDYGWTDEGIVIQTREGDDYNAIDPAVFRGEDGRLWLAFGSYWSGIKLIELDPKTGKRIAPDSPMHSLAWQREIEAPAIYFHDGYHYLFVNWGLCCRGVNSTYNIRVGRSRNVEGPYVDRQGVELGKGGGTLLVGSEGPFICPGHAGVFTHDGRLWLSMHFYDGTDGGKPKLAIRPLQWDADGWPTVGE